MSTKTFVYSDTHLCHANIIRYCNRPFKNVDEMNTTIVNNWNDVVSDCDDVYIVGDFARSKHPRDWLMKLNGNIRLIKGNHDKYLKAPLARVINYQGESLLLTHNPYDAERLCWKGWTIAGHHHNNNLVIHPLVNNVTKVCNVSCELVNYYPIGLDQLLSKRM